MWKAASSIVSKGQPRLGRLTQSFDHSVYHCPKTTRAKSFGVGLGGAAVLLAAISRYGHRHGAH